MASGFATAGLTTVLLPSGYRVRGVIPGLAELVRSGLVDDRVRVAVIRLTDDKWLKAASEDAQEENLRVYVDALVAGFCREALDPGDDPEAGEWKPLELSVDDLAGMDQRDRDRLEDLVMRVFTAEQITTAVEAGDYAMREVGSSLDALAEFRDQLDGAAGSGDGEGVDDTSVLVAGGGR